MNTLSQELKNRPITSIVTLVLLFTLIIALYAATLRQNWLFMLITILAGLLICLPRYIERYSKIVIPAGLQIFLICFTYAALFLGDLNHYYNKYFWWDTLLHTSSGFAFGIVAFLILYLITKSSTLKINPWTIAVFSFSFSIAIGTIWEIIEFAIDITLGTSLQSGSMMNGNSLYDTMKDLIVDSIGAFIAALLGYLFLKFKTRTLVHPILADFKQINQRLFKKKKLLLPSR